VEVDLHVPHAEEAQAASFGVELPARSVLPLHRVEAPGRLEPGEPRFIASLAASVEGGEGPVETLEGPPAHHHPVVEHLGAYGAQLGEGPALVEIRHRAPFPSPRTAAILEGGVVELALLAKDVFKRGPLPDGGLQ